MAAFVQQKTNNYAVACSVVVMSDTNPPAGSCLVLFSVTGGTTVSTVSQGCYLDQGRTQADLFKMSQYCAELNRSGWVHSLSRLRKNAPAPEIVATAAEALTDAKWLSRP